MVELKRYNCEPMKIHSFDRDSFCINGKRKHMFLASETNLSYFMFPSEDIASEILLRRHSL